MLFSKNNSDFENHLCQMHPVEILKKKTTVSNTSASYVDWPLLIEKDGQLHIFTYFKRDHFNFSITNYPFLSSNIPFLLAYGVFISYLIRYTRACSSCECYFRPGVFPISYFIPFQYLLLVYDTCTNFLLLILFDYDNFYRKK